MSPSLAPPPCSAGSALLQRWLALPSCSCLNSQTSTPSSLSLGLVSLSETFLLIVYVWHIVPGRRKYPTVPKVPCVCVWVCVFYVCVCFPAHILVHCLKHARTHTCAHTHTRTQTQKDKETDTHTVKDRQTHTQLKTDRHTHPDAPTSHI